MENAITARSDLPVARHEVFAHQADVGVRGFGATPSQAFEQAALALVSVVTEADVRAEVEARVELDSPDIELLFYSWMNAIVAEMGARGMVFARFEVVIEGARLEGRAFGEEIDRSRHEPAVEPKGATFTELAVREEAPGRWLAQCVVDV